MVRYQQKVRFSFIKKVDSNPAVRMEEALLNAKNTTAGALGTTKRARTKENKAHTVTIAPPVQAYLLICQERERVKSIEAPSPIKT